MSTTVAASGPGSERGATLGASSPAAASSSSRSSSPALQSSAVAASPASDRAEPTATSWISARLAAPTSAAPALESIRSRASERSCWRTRPAMRTTTRPKSAIDAPVTTAMSRSRRWMSCTRLITGATSDAHVSSASRKRVSIESRRAERCSSWRHRRMQRRRSPQQVEADPADVEPELVGVGPVQDQQAVDEVGRQQQDDARAEQVERGRAPAAVEREPDRRREQQDVAERIGDRDELGDRRELVVVQVRRHQRDPLRQREADGEDQAVDHAAAVAAAAAPPDQQQQPGHQHGVDEHVGGVAGRRERDVAVEQQRVAVGVEVAEPEQEEADGEEDPGRDRARPVQPHADDDRQHRREPEQVHHRPAAAERRQQHVRGGQQRAERQVREPGGRAAHVSRPATSVPIASPGARSSPRSASSSSALSAASTSASVFAAVSCMRKPTSAFGTSG